MDTPLVGRVRWMAQALMVSGALNIGLIATFLYFVLKDSKETPQMDLKPATEQVAKLERASNPQLLAHYQAMSFRQLLDKLTNTQKVEDGYTQRDLALGCLVTFHQFDLAKALSGQTVEQRRLAFGPKGAAKLTEVRMFPGVTNAQYEAIVHYAQTEKWPLTAQGVFQKLQEGAGKEDPSLTEAFYLSPEYQSIEALFSRSEVAVDRDELLATVLEGDFSSLQEFTAQQRLAQDLSAGRRQQLLLDLVAHNSAKAAYLLLKTEGSYAAKKFSDGQVIQMLTLAKTKTPESEHFAVDLLTSPRSSAVWELAAQRLYEFHGEQAPSPIDHIAALNRFVPEELLQEKMRVAAGPSVEAAQKTAKTAADSAQKSMKIAAKPKTAAAEKSEVTYVVQPGDSLWKIAKKHKVTIKEIRKLNNMDSDKIKPGAKLRIPAES